MTGFSEMCKLFKPFIFEIGFHFFMPSVDREIVLVALLALYVLWLLVLLILNSSKIIQLSSPFRFLFVITIFIYCIVLTGLFAGYFYPLSTSAVVFLCFYSVINFYIWTLAFAFAPLGTDEG